MNTLLLSLALLAAPGDGLPVPDDFKWAPSLRPGDWTTLPVSTHEERLVREQARKAWAKQLRQEEAFFLRSLRRNRLYLRNYTPPPVEPIHRHPTR